MATLNIDKFVDKIIANAEGTYAHTDSAEIPTDAYGLTDAAKVGMRKKGENESPRDYAKYIIENKYIKEAKKKLGEDVWNKLPEGMKVVALDVHYNAGLGGNPSFVKSLKNEDYPAALKNTLDIVGVTTKDGTNYSSSGLAKRRASIYNVGAAGLNLPLITNTLASKREGDKSQVSYFTGDGKDVLLALDLNKPLALDSSEGFKAPVDYGYQADTPAPQFNNLPPIGSGSTYSMTPQQMESKVYPPSISDAPYPEVSDRYKMELLSKPNVNSREGVKRVQAQIGADVDGIWGKQSQALFDIHNRQVYDNKVRPPSDTYRQEGFQRPAPRNPSLLERGVNAIVPSAQAAEMPVAPPEKQYATMEDLLIDKDLMQNPLLFNDEDAKRMWLTF